MYQKKGKEILLQIIGLVMTTSLVMGYFPIGMGYFAALYGNCGMRVLTLLLYVAGAAWSMSFMEVLKYTMAMLVLVCSVALAEYRTKQKNYYLYALFAGISITIMEWTDTIMQAMSSSATAKEMVMELAVGILTFALTVIFSVGMEGILEHNSHMDFSGEEIISMASIVGISLFFISDKTVLPFALTQTFIYTSLLLLGFKYGVGMGAVTGTACGIVWGLATGNLEMIGFLGILGIFAGAFRELGRLTSILGVLFGVLMIGYNYCPVLLENGWIQGFLASGVVFMLLPSSVAFVYHAKKREEPPEEVILENHSQIQHIAELFGHMAGTLWEIPTQVKGLAMRQVNEIVNEHAASVMDKYEIMFVDELPGEMEMEIQQEMELEEEKGVFQGMPPLLLEELREQKRRQRLEELRQQNEIRAKKRDELLRNMKKMATKAKRKGMLDRGDIPDVFADECSDVERFLIDVNHDLEKARLDLLWKNKLMDSREAVALQLQEMSQILQSCTNDEYIMVPIEQEREEYIRKRFKSAKMVIKRMTMLEDKRHNRELILTLRAERGNCITTKEAANLLGECMEMELVMAADSRNVIGQEEVSITFREDTKFRVLHGCVKKVKDKERISGDNFIVSQLENGQFFIGLSDGMGSGLGANHDSAMVMELLGQMLECGFATEAALRLINSCLLMNPQVQGPTTLDMGVIDLYSGMCDFVKLGAASTFIKRGNWVEVMKSTSMPMGVLGQVDLDSTSKKLYDGDYVIMVSDGIVEALEAKNKEYAMSSIIQDIQLKNPKEMARAILRKAMEHVDNVPTDDMTVLVTGIWNKSAA